MAVNTSENSQTHQNIMLFQSIFGPDFVIGNLFRCFAVFSFLTLAMIFKTVFTIGLADTFKYFGNTNTSDAYGMVTSEKFLKGAITRTFFNSLFLIVGWGIVALIAKKKLTFLSENGKRKRRRRSLQPGELIFESNILFAYERILAKLQ